MDGSDIFHREWRIAATEHGVKITAKDISLRGMWKLCSFLLYILTFGDMKDFYTKYTTVIGRTIYFPSGWSSKDASYRDVITLRHELIHIKQCKKCGLGSYMLGSIIMAILYFLIPLPMGLAWFRYKFEREAYVVSWNSALEFGLKPNLDQYVERMTGPAYLWAWPFKDKVHAWFKANCNPI